MQLTKDSEPLRPEECAGVGVFVEQRHGKPASVSVELLGEGRRLADALGQPLHAVVLGSGVEAAVEEVRHFGPDKVHVVDDPALDRFLAEPYAAALVAVARAVKPSILLVGQSNVTRSFAPAVALALGTGLVGGCTQLALDDAKQNLVQTRPAFGGTVFASVLTERARPQIASVRPRMFQPAARRDAASGEVVAHAFPSDGAARTKFLESVNELGDAVDLTEAETIVSGGRGLGGPEAFAMIRELADAMGGVVGASRAAVDAGWISYSHQVGQTGKIVKPRIYVACGISGAIQHQVGMRSSDCIIAINRDREAPIFKLATYGLVGDIKQIVPALTRRFRQG